MRGGWAESQDPPSAKPIGSPPPLCLRHPPRPAPLLPVLGARTPQQHPPLRGLGKLMPWWGWWARGKGGGGIKFCSAPRSLQARCIYNASDLLPLRMEVAVPPTAAPLAVLGPLGLQLRIATGEQPPRRPLCHPPPAAPLSLSPFPQTRATAPTTPTGTTPW